MRPNETKFINQTKKLDRDRNSSFGSAAFNLCKGEGLEIGAVNCPFDVDANVTYLDQVNTQELLRRHADDANVEDVIPVTLVSKRLNYNFIADEAYDFAVASHVLEHMANPGKTIRELSRIIRPNGVLYFVVPHKDRCFDHSRRATPLNELVWKYISNIDEISLPEYLEFVFAMHGVDGLSVEGAERLVDEAKRLYENQIDFHVQTFTEISFWAFLDWIAPRVGCEVVHRQWDGDLHIHGALRKFHRNNVLS